MGLVCIFSAASGRILFLDPRLGELANAAATERGSRACDIVEELLDPSPRRFVARLRFGTEALYDITVRRLPAGPLLPVGAIEASFVPAGERADPALDLFGALWALEDAARPEGVAEVLAAILRASEARAVALGAKTRDVMQVEAVASAGAWPELGARLALGSGRRGFECHDLERDGSGAHALALAYDAGRTRPRWIGEKEVAAVVESLAYALARERAPASEITDGFAQERGGARAALVASAGDGSAIDLAIVGAGAIENQFGESAVRVALDELDTRLRTLLRRDESLFRVAVDRFFVVVPQRRTRDEVLGLARRIDGIVRYPIVFAERRFALGARLAAGDLPSDAVSLEAVRAAFEPLEESPRDIAPSIHGFLACFDPIARLGGAGVDGAEMFVRRVDPKYGVLAPERLETVAVSEVERLNIARWLVDEAASALDEARPRGLRELYVNICALAPESVEVLVGSDRFGEYRMKGLRFELTAQQLESVPAHLARANAAGGFAVALQPADPARVATLRRNARFISDVVLAGSLVDEESARPRTRAMLLAAASDFARSLGARARARGPHVRIREEQLRRLGIGAIQAGTGSLTSGELLRLVRARASEGSA